MESRTERILIGVSFGMMFLIMIFLVYLMFAGESMSIDCPESIYENRPEEVSAIVVNKEYIESTSYIYFNPALKMLMPYQEPAKYYVEIAYEDVSEIFNSQTLYDSTEVGDIIKVYLYKKFDNDNNLINESIGLIHP